MLPTLSLCVKYRIAVLYWHSILCLPLCAHGGSGQCGPRHEAISAHPDQSSSKAIPVDGTIDTSHEEPWRQESITDSVDRYNPEGSQRSQTSTPYGRTPHKRSPTGNCWFQLTRYNPYDRQRIECVFLNHVQRPLRRSVTARMPAGVRVCSRGVSVATKILTRLSNRRQTQVCKTR